MSRKCGCIGGGSAGGRSDRNNVTRRPGGDPIKQARKRPARAAAIATRPLSRPSA